MAMQQQLDTTPVQCLSSKEEIEAKLVEAGDKLVLIDFYATWCKPCEALKPVFKRCAEEYSNVIFCKVDIDEAQDIDEFKIQKLPTIVFFKKGKEVKKLIGFDIDKLKHGIQSFM
ncbi:thioredoxin-like isoform X1 [Narcine bancroftii]|uniref:thioredoxin-like isoform X1 n=1 Tax=Narcine bancroftii TaxID=1343680 RepID=UPI0038312C03